MSNLINRTRTARGRSVSDQLVMIPAMSARVAFVPSPETAAFARARTVLSNSLSDNSKSWNTLAWFRKKALG